MSATDTDSTPPAIVVRDLVTHYGHRQILFNVSFTLPPGEIVVILGGSGSGKSTLLNHMLGLLRPTSGAVELLGTDINKARGQAMQRLRRQIGVAFQGGALLSSMTVGDNIRLPIVEHARLGGETVDIMMRMKLEVVELSGFEDLMPSQLSGGMIKRAALARAMVLDPRLLFCDEPSAGLDPVVAAGIDDLLLRLRDAFGMTIVVVTHELASAFRIADRFLVLDRGHLRANGSPAEVQAMDDRRVQDLLNREAPQSDAFDADEYVARLVGSVPE